MRRSLLPHARLQLTCSHERLTTASYAPSAPTAARSPNRCFTRLNPQCTAIPPHQFRWQTHHPSEASLACSSLNALNATRPFRCFHTGALLGPRILYNFLEPVERAGRGHELEEMQEAGDVRKIRGGFVNRQLVEPRYKELMSELSQSGAKSETLKSLLKLVENSELDLDKQEYALLMRAAFHARESDVSVGFFKCMQRQKLEPDEEHMVALLRACIHSYYPKSHNHLAHYAGDWLVKAGVSVGAVLYIRYLKIFTYDRAPVTRERTIRKMLRVYSQFFPLDTIRSLGLIPPKEVRSLAPRDSRDARSVGLHLHADAMGNLISRLIAYPHASLREPSLLYNQYLNLRAAVQRADDDALLLAMEPKHVYKAFLDEFRRHPRLVKYLPEILQDVETLVDREKFAARFGRERKSAILRARTWEPMLHGLIESSQLDAAMKGFDMLLQHGVAPTISIWSSVLYAIGKSQDVERLASLIETATSHTSIDQLLDADANDIWNQRPGRSKHKMTWWTLSGMITRAIHQIEDKAKLRELVSDANWERFAPEEILPDQVRYTGRFSQAEYTAHLEDQEDYFEEWDDYLPTRTPAASIGTITSASLSTEASDATNVAASNDAVGEDYFEEWDDESEGTVDAASVEQNELLPLHTVEVEQIQQTVEALLGTVRTRVVPSDSQSKDTDRPNLAALDAGGQIEDELLNLDLDFEYTRTDRPLPTEGSQADPETTPVQIPPPTQPNIPSTSLSTAETASPLPPPARPSTDLPAQDSASSPPPERKDASTDAFATKHPIGRKVKLSHLVTKKQSHVPIRKSWR